MEGMEGRRWEGERKRKGREEKFIKGKNIVFLLFTYSFSDFFLFLI